MSSVSTNQIAVFKTLHSYLLPWEHECCRDHNNKAHLLGSHIYSTIFTKRNEVRSKGIQGCLQRGVMTLDIPSHPPHPGRSLRGRPAELDGWIFALPVGLQQLLSSTCVAGAHPPGSGRPPFVCRWTSVVFALRESSSIEEGTLSVNVSISHLKVSISFGTP
jgi:hypothetical protein